jgi:hypothetical protein
MHKLIIYIDSLADYQTFDEGWPEFLHQAEQMPGFVRETHSKIEDVLFGNSSISVIHELYFETREDLQIAMTSPQGQAAGKILQCITKGQMKLLIADHKEDDLENLRKYRSDDADAE